MVYKCSKHHSVTAGWRCSSCSATLCADCTGWKTAGVSRLEVCARCGGFAKQILVARGELSPFSARQLLTAVRWPFSKMGLLSIFASAMLVTAFAYLGSKASAIAAGVMIAYLFQVVRHTANGKDDFPGPEDFQGYLEDVVAPSFRLAVALAWIWIPAVAWMFWHRAPAEDVGQEQRRAVEMALRPGGPGLAMRGMKVVTNGSGALEVQERNAPPPVPSPEQLERMKAEEEQRVDPAADPAAAPALAEVVPEAPPRSHLVPILLVIFGVVIAPMSLIASALKTPLWVAANPLFLAGYALKLGRDYALLVCFCIAAAGTALLVRVLGIALAPPIIFGKLPVNIAVLMVGFAAFRAIGLLVRARGGDLGYGDEAAHLVPVLGDEEPRLVIEEKAAPVEAPPPERQPIELPPQDSAEQFTQLLAQKDVDGCIALLEQSWQAVPGALLSAKGWLDLAKAAHQRGKGKPAAAALRRCLDLDSQGPLAPQAILFAARVYDELLRDRAASQRLLQELVKRFPASQEGVFAGKRLAAAGK
ncbi:MAG TPA: hypothetical protein VF993_14485 [Myxococcales bacterium]